MRRWWARSRTVPFGEASWATSWGGGEFGQVGDFSEGLVSGGEAVDAAELVSGAEVFEFLLPFVGDPLGVLDDEADHIGDVEGAVGTGAGEDGARPGVGGGE